MLEIGSLVDGKYKILNVVGKGGMSVVYLAMNERANKQWAIKEVRKDGMQDFEVVKQNLVVETDMLKNLSHPNLPSIIDVIDTEDSFLIVMDYIEGRGLDSLLKEFGAQPQEYVIEWAKQLCDVLGYLHTRKPPIIYRDMKPSNVMLKPDGDVTLIDFGTAREFKATSVEDTTCLGTRGYAAPEQYGGHGQTDARTDVYCLGATLYHLVTGHNPAQPPYEMYPIRQWDPNLSSGLEEIILKCTKYNPSDRYQNCQELLYALEHYDELDEEYRSSQKSKLKIFAVTAGITAVLGLTSLITGIHSRNLTTRSYDSLLKQAETLDLDNEDQFKEYVDNIKRAVRLDKDNETAYNAMLDKFANDFVITEEEQTAIINILNAKDGSMRNVDYFKNNKEEYAKLNYKLGVAYFFYYQGDKGKTYAQTYFNNSLQNREALDEGEAKRAEIYARIGDYYGTLGKEDPSGENNIKTYRNFFSDLKELNQYGSGDLGETGAIFLYKEVASQIAKHALDFMANGNDISADQLKAEITRIRDRIVDLEGLVDEEKLNDLKENLDQAEYSINSVNEDMSKQKKDGNEETKQQNTKNTDGGK